MDGIGYGNWNSQNRRHTGGDLEDSYDSSSPPTFTSDPYGFDSDIGQGVNRSKSYSKASSKKDAYDFNLTADMVITLPRVLRYQWRNLNSPSACPPRNELQRY